MIKVTYQIVRLDNSGRRMRKATFANLVEFAGWHEAQNGKEDPNNPDWVVMCNDDSDSRLEIVGSISPNSERITEANY